MTTIRFPNESTAVEINNFDESKFIEDKTFGDETFGTYKGSYVAITRNKKQ